MDVMSRVVLLGLFTVASARQHAMRGIDSPPTREEFLAVLAENKVLREEIAALRAGRGGGGRALKFGYHAVEGESQTTAPAPTASPFSVGGDDYDDYHDSFGDYVRDDDSSGRVGDYVGVYDYSDGEPQDDDGGLYDPRSVYYDGLFHDD